MAAAAHRRHIYGVPQRPTPPKKPTAAKLRNWRVAIMRSRAHNLGTVEAPDAKAAEAEAVKAFGLDEDQRKRLKATVERIDYGPDVRLPVAA
jgi:hypothetical protein